MRSNAALPVLAEVCDVVSKSLSTVRLDLGGRKQSGRSIAGGEHCGIFRESWVRTVVRDLLIVLDRHFVVMSGVST